MNRLTIDFGIDLGTTNSSIAVIKGTEVEVFKNNENSEITPSAVYIDKKNSLFTGNAAKSMLESDLENSASEFKLKMGTSFEKVFVRSGRRMKPEDMSAEILKALKSDVRQRTGEDVQAAVITVPAAFELPQNAATNRSAEMAGFKLAPLLQEPVAAAMAYGFQSTSDKVFWLVYDFGGGTFDAAIIQVRDGVIEVVNHGGDNQMGGKLIDWSIVDELLIPAVVKEYKLKEFHRGNPKWAGAFAKLKSHAEEAKKRVSRQESSGITIDFLCNGEDGHPIQFEYDLLQKDVARLAEPFFLGSIRICKKVLTEKRLGVGNIEKVLLVGGPTLMPSLRELLNDREKGLGIPLDYSIDPLTVVARGAAVFAGTKRMDGVFIPSVQTGQFALELEYQPTGSETEPLVGGKVIASETVKLSGYTIEFVNAEARPQWRSGKIPLGAEGTFVTNLWAEKGRLNTFWIELLDANGTKQETVPNRLEYKIGLTITAPPLTHSVGVAMANNEMEKFLEKGAPLPARKRKVFRTAIDIRRGQNEDLLRIPVVEGENIRRADRNHLIGYLEISGTKIKRDVPASSEIEVTIEMDASRLIRTKAYIPILDEEFEEVIVLGKTEPEPEKLKKEYDSEKKRLDDVKQKASTSSDDRAMNIINQVEDEQIPHQIETSLNASTVDSEAADKCENKLLELKSRIDEIEDILEWPTIVKEAGDQLSRTKEIVDSHGSSGDKLEFNSLEQEMKLAMRSTARDTDTLRRLIDELSTMSIRILREQPGFWVAILQNLEEMKDKMKNQSEASQLFSQGNRAINNNDIVGLKSAIQQLFKLLPPAEQQQVRGFGSGVTL
ncbi:MAG: Hsp70 family protein [Candidatus Zhuqueibacterota bacterium]